MIALTHHLGQRLTQRARHLMFAVFSASLLVAAPVYADHHGDKKADADIVDTAVAAGNFETLVTAVQAAGLVDTLKGEGPFTVFAPTDEAFAKIPRLTWRPCWPTRTNSPPY